MFREFFRRKASAAVRPARILLTCVNKNPIAGEFVDSRQNGPAPSLQDDNKERRAAVMDNGTHQNGRDSRLLEAVLGGAAIFRNVAPEHIASVAAHARSLHLRRGTQICARGKALPGIVLTAYGTVKLSLSKEQGDEKVVRFLEPGTAFGLACALQDQPSPVDVTALTDSGVVLIPALPLQRLLELDARFARNLVRELSGKFLALLAEFDATLHRSALERLAHYLVSLAEPNGVAGAYLVRLPATKTAVAARLGVTKETLSRQLRVLSERGLVVVGHHDIEIRDLQALSQIGR